MMQGNFARSLAAVLVHEGGYVNDPVDPGGATNKGVTQAVYNSWRITHGQAARSVRHIEQAELLGIYKLRYWDQLRGDDLPSGVDYAVFDFAVNSGVSRASHVLQGVVGAVQDGKIGSQTISAVKALAAVRVIDRLCDKRLGFLRSLHRIFWRFGKGWTVRVAHVRKQAKQWA